MQEFLKIRAIEDTVSRRTREVDDKLMFGGGTFSRSGLGGLSKEKCRGVSLLRRKLSKAVPGTDHLEGLENYRRDNVLISSPQDLGNGVLYSCLTKVCPDFAAQCSHVKYFEWLWLKR